MDRLRNNLRYTLRSWIRQPGVTVVALLALALGIGANSAIFSVVYAVLVNPLPYPDADRLMTVWMDNRLQGWPQDVTSYPNYVDWRDRSETFVDMAAISTIRDTITGIGEPDRVLAQRVTPTFFDVLGVDPAMGRGFAVSDWGLDDRLVVLSHGAWQRRFGGADDVLGRTLEVNGETHTVVGVMPEGFQYTRDNVEYWRLFAADVQETGRGGYWLEVAGRLQPGVTVAAARADLDRVGAMLEAEYPDLNTGYGVTIVPLYDEIVGDVRPALLLLLGAVGLVLLICCANVANLMLVRATARRREMAVRAALGADGRRLLGQTLTESLTLALAGGGLGLILAWVGVRYLRSAEPDLPRLAEVGLHPPVLLFTLAAAMATGVVFGMAPALQSVWTNLASAIGDRGAGGEGRHVGRLRAGLVVAELALALVLLIGAGLLLRSYSALTGAGPGFDARGVLAFTISLSGPNYDSSESARVFFDSLLEKLEAIPGASSVGMVNNLPLTGGFSSGFFTIEGQPPVPRSERREVKNNVVSRDYFATMRIPLLAGRTFDESDNLTSERVLVVNSAFVDAHLPGEEAVGRRYLFGSPDRYASPDNPNPELPWYRIIGVVEGSRQRGLDRMIEPEVFTVFDQIARPTMTVAMRTEGDPLSLATAARESVWSIDPNLPVSNLATMTDVLGRAASARRFNTTLLGLFSFVALVLAATGLYGVMSYWVTRQTREIGVRVALGARGSDVIWLILRRTTAITAAGVLVGVGAALGLTRLMAGLLYGVASTDTATFLTVPALLTAIAMLASALPAVRATRVDPIEALRDE